MRVRGSTSAHDNQLIIALCLLLLIWHYTPVEGIPDRRGGEDGPAADPVWGWEERENGGGFPMIGRLKRVAQGAANVPISF